MKMHLFQLTVAVAACVGSLGCVGRVAHNLPPSQRLLEPGPGVGGPGPGVITPASANIGMGPVGGGVNPAMFGGMGGPMGGPGMCGPGCGPGGCGPDGVMLAGMSAGATSQIAFLGVEGAEVSWDTSGSGMFDSSPLVMPGRQNFPQGAIYRLKLTNIPDRPGVELYPTLEIAPVTPRTDAYLAHSPIPIQFTDEDLDQVLAGNFVTKVIYLPDPEFQEMTMSGVAELVSTRLDPGVDPISEADRRGAILAILRIGNLDLQLPGEMVAMGGSDVQPAQYYGEDCYDGEGMGPGDGGMGYGGMPYGGACYGPAGAPGPVGMPTAGFAPAVAPPHLVSGVNGPQYGMPFTGTPIGLPGPPHIPLGHGAGLTSHTITNHTRVNMPPPVHNMKMSVRQRPGMNYPRPVNHVNVAEVNRAPLNICHGCCIPGCLHRACDAIHGCNQAGQECPQECPPY